LDKSVREDPEKYGIAKITETVVLNTIISQEEYKEAYHEFLEIQHEYNIAKAAVRAFAQRKDALENLVRLHGQQYFAGPRVPRNISEEREKFRSKNNTKVRIRNKR
jgi:5'-deoxynucleotidase YfbR-like HD superfamily hydrolase